MKVPEEIQIYTSLDKMDNALLHLYSETKGYILPDGMLDLLRLKQCLIEIYKVDEFYAEEILFLFKEVHTEYRNFLIEMNKQPKK